MANFNKVILAGNMTRDPELSYTASNMPICKFGIAINRKWRDKSSGETREETCFVDCTAFGRTGEVINQYMGKGKPIFVEGRLNFRQWEAQDGGKRSKLDVVVENFQFIGGQAGPGGTSQGGPAGGRQARPAPVGAKARSADAPPPDDYDDYGPPPTESGDEVPF